MKYVANPVEVEAFKIVSVGEDSKGNVRICALDNGESRIADEGMVARYQPVPGDYWVIQADGYEYLNPKDVFERKYRQVFTVEYETKAN